MSTPSAFTHVATWPLLFRLASRNLWLYRVRTVITGGLLGFGAFLAVFGLSILRDIEGSMRDSITQSIAGDLQVYSTKAKDDLAIFGGNFMGRVDIGSMPDLVPYRDEVMKNPNVAAFVPMGQDAAILGRGNEMDGALDALRAAYKSGDPAELKDRIEQLRFQLEQLKTEVSERKKLARDTEEIDKQAADLAAAEAPAFLAALTTPSEERLQFLETKIAPISGEKQPIYLNYLGTDIALFQANFPKFKVVEGDALPEGSRGILISKKVREDWLKNLVARLFDKLNKAIVKSGKKIKGDAENERMAADLPRQYAQVLNLLSRQDAEQVAQALAARGIPGPTDAGATLTQTLTAQLKEFLKVDDANFKDRYDWFYANIAPKIRLYEISPGESITLRTYTRSGYVKSVPLKVYGVYSFDGLEDSDLAGAMNIIDLVSFRELFGQMSESAQKELEAMRDAAGIKAVTQENAEDALFGASSGTTLEARKEVASGTAAEAIEVKPVIADKFDVAEVQHGLALNAAVILKDPEQLQKTQKELEEALKAKGLEMRVVDWQTASGIVGQFVNIVRMALIFSIIVIFIVALVIINNSIIVATLNRIREIGTMRAIGAQRSFVTGLFLAETGLVGLVGAILGAALAAVVLGVLNKSGIPAGSDVIAFLFSGPRLFPHLRWPLVFIAPLVVAGVAVVSSIYAARHASHIRPAEAMQEKE